MCVVNNKCIVLDTMKKKIGILTWHYYKNYGSGLQAFALQETIVRLGHDVNLINFRKFHTPQVSPFKNIVKKILQHVAKFSDKIYNKVVNNTFEYQKRYLKQTKQFNKPVELENISGEYDCLVYGSDQIWAPNVYTPIYMGAHVQKNVRKISYAASIGLNDIPDDLVETYRTNLSSYDSVAVREQEGKELLKSKCGIDSTVVLDPTLLIDADTYRNMQRPVRGVKGKYIFCYFLNKEHKYKEKIQKYAQECNLQIIGTSDREEDAAWMTRLTNIGADQFIWLINNAETIFTDSYHGSIFSLLLHKNLWTYVRFAEDNPICQNSRIRQLQNNFNLSHRVITYGQEIDDALKIDYDYFEKRLAELRKESLAYLKNALE